jgi:hypothetical protein
MSKLISGPGTAPEIVGLFTQKNAGYFSKNV